MKNNKYSSISSLITSIVLFIIGTLLFTSEDVIVELISQIFGALLSIIGLFNIVLYIRRKKHDIPTNRLDITFGVIMCVIGLLFIFLSGAFATAIRFVMGAWILLSGINKLIAALSGGPLQKNYTSMLIVSFILIFIGGYIILKSNLVIKGIGLAIMIYSILEIVGYIIFKISENQTKDNQDNDVIVPVKTNKKDNSKVKEAKVKDKEK